MSLKLMMEEFFAHGRDAVKRRLFHVIDLDLFNPRALSKGRRNRGKHKCK